MSAARVALLAAALLACLARAAAAEPQFGAVGPEEWRRRILAADAPERQYELVQTLIRGGSKAVPVLIALLEGPEEDVISAAIFSLGSIGTRAAAAGPALARLAREGTSGRSFLAAMALAEIGIESETAARALVPWLADASAEKRLLAANALGRACAPGSPASAAALPALLIALGDGSEAVAAAAAAAIGRCGETAVAPLVDLLCNDMDARRHRAAAALGEIGEPALPAIVTILREGPQSARRFAVEAAAKMGPRAAPLVPDLLALDDLDGVLGDALSKVFHEIGPAAVPALTAALDSPAADLRWRAARRLGPLGLAARDAVPALVRRLGDSDALVRDAAEQALGRIGPAAGPALLAALDDGAAPVRAAAARLLGALEIWAPAGAAAALGKRAAEDPDPAVKTAAAAALARLRPPEDGPHARALARLADDDVMVRSAAASELVAAGAAAVPGLVKALADPARQEKAIEVLARIGPAAKDAVPALVDLLRAPALRYPVSGALLTIREGVVTALAAALESPEAMLREGAAKALGEFGPDAAAAVPALEGLLSDPVERVQQAAKRALERVRGK